MELLFQLFSKNNAQVFWSFPSARRSCVCVSRLRSHVSTGQFSSTAAGFSCTEEKPFLVTTPIFYANAEPHIGHMYSMALADSLKRWQMLLGRKALLSTGTDEHGQKVQRAATFDADPEKRDPKRFVDKASRIFKTLAQECHVDHDFFIRTTDPKHRDAVEYAWIMLRERGHIYMSKHEGWYSISDECFYPDSGLVRKQDPLTGRVYPSSAETGSMVEWVEEKNYHFRMTAFKDHLLDFYDKKPAWIVPQTRMKEVISWVKNNLEDLSVSRSAERLRWGIPVPDDPSQTIYVWLDALINYLTVTGYPNRTPGRMQEEGWPADIHVIGKDIAKFHCVYWPALLMALDISLPKRVLCHAHWTMEKKKMSKSTGNVVNPFFAMERFGSETMRYCLLHDGSIANDADYSNEMVVSRYKHHLQFGLGNLTGRVLRTKKWNVRDIIEDTREKHVTNVDAEDAVFQAEMEEARAQESPKTNGQAEITPVSGRFFRDQLEMLTEMPTLFSQNMDELDPVHALRIVSDSIAKTNKFMTATKPWALVKRTVKDEDRDAASKERLRKAIYLTAEALRVSGILLQPFMPVKAVELLDMLGVDPARRKFAHAKLHADFDYGVPILDPGSSAYDGLFPPLEAEE